MSSFCNAKATHIFSAKIINVFARFQDKKFNILIANNLSFEQLGPDIFLISPLKYMLWVLIRSASQRHIFMWILVPIWSYMHCNIIESVLTCGLSVSKVTVARFCIYY